MPAMSIPNCHIPPDVILTIFCCHFDHREKSQVLKSSNMPLELTQGCGYGGGGRKQGVFLW